VRMVTVTEPLATRISSGSSTASVSGRRVVLAPSAPNVTRTLGVRFVTRPTTAAYAGCATFAASRRRGAGWPWAIVVP
jgi:hypothetical protein